MRWLMWLSIGFAAACAVGVYVASGTWLWIAGGLLLAGSIAALFVLNRCDKRLHLRFAAALLLGLGLGLIWMQSYNACYLNKTAEHNGKNVSASVEVCDYSYLSNGRTVADCYIELSGSRFLTRCYFRFDDALEPGDTVCGDFFLRATTVRDEQNATHHQGKGIFLLAYADEDSKIDRGNAVPLKYSVAKLRKGILDALTEVFPEDTESFARALLLGDTSMLSYEEDTAYKISGIRHIIAVSGLHVSILFSFVCLLSGHRRVLTAVLGIPALVLFAALAGFTPSIVRACVMQALMILSLLFDKEYDTKTALAFAVLVILAVNPWAISSVGFQLSVGCTLGIIVFYSPLNAYFKKLLRCPKEKGIRSKIIRWISANVSVTISATVITAPLSAFYFGTVSISGILSNLLVLWCVCLTFYGIMIACALGAIWPLGGVGVGWLVSWPIRYISGVAKVMSALPFASLYTCSVYTVAWIIFVYILLAVFWITPQKRPMILAACITGGLVLSILASCISPRMDRFRLTVLDVGQGQSVIWSCDGKNYLIDCGGDYPKSAADTAAQTLLSQGIRQLDGVILTHYDRDHSGGIRYLLSRIKTQALYLPDIEDDTGMRELLLGEYSDVATLVKSQKEISTANMQMTLFPGEKGKQENESGICILFQAENCDILLTGDRGISGERALIQSAKLPEIELLVVGHHGAQGSAGYELLSVTKPAAAVISVGKDNRYGHPHASVLERLGFFGCAVWRTDRDGTIVFRR